MGRGREKRRGGRWVEGGEGQLQTLKKHLEMWGGGVDCILIEMEALALTMLWKLTTRCGVTVSSPGSVRNSRLHPLGHQNLHLHEVLG